MLRKIKKLHEFSDYTCYVKCRLVNIAFIEIMSWTVLYLLIQNTNFGYLLCERALT